MKINVGFLLVQACIKMTASDLIHGIQAWYRRIIRRVTMIQPSFQQEWFFNGLIGPISAQGNYVYNNIL